MVFVYSQMNIRFKLILKCLVITHLHGLLLLLSSMKFSKNFACAKAAGSFKYGGDEEIRTPDPLLARQVLSQLS